MMDVFLDIELNKGSGEATHFYLGSTVDAFNLYEEFANKNKLPPSYDALNDRDYTIEKQHNARMSEAADYGGYLEKQNKFLKEIQDKFTRFVCPKCLSDNVRFWDDCFIMGMVGQCMDCKHRVEAFYSGQRNTGNRIMDSFNIEQIGEIDKALPNFKLLNLEIINV